VSDSARARARLERELRREVVIEPNPALGLIAMGGPNDPEPGLTIDDGVVVEMDGRPAADFDLIDRFIVDYGLDLTETAGAMSLNEVEIARMLVDIDVPRSELVRLASGLTPARLARVVSRLDPVEMMLALKKMRARNRPANQAHVTNRKESPVLLAADAAEAAIRGFAEIETTVGVSRMAPLNAIAILVGSQVGRPGVLTQCAVEERKNLELGMLGLTTYSETLSVYGTESCMIDGDDTPWSKALLASAYASRGIKVRFTSGTGSEALMTHSDGFSMLYLEARCLWLVRAAGSQGVQNGSISAVALPLSLPGGTKAILGENLIGAWLDLEVASGNDAVASHSAIRKTAKLMGQFLPGTDFVTSGYSVMPKRDNMFGGGNFDSDDLDEWTTIQRDWQVDAGIEPVNENEVLRVREEAARTIQALYRSLGFPPITDEEIRSAVYGYDSRDMPDRDRLADLEAADRVLSDGITGVSLARALDLAGQSGPAEAILGMQRLRVSGDYLQTSAIVEPGWAVVSAVNDPNEYRGPGTGYRLDGERWERLRRLPHQSEASTKAVSSRRESPAVVEIGDAIPGGPDDEVVIAVGPAFLSVVTETIGGLAHENVLTALVDGIEGEGASCRVVRVRRTSDVAFIGHDGAGLSGSGVGVGIQSKGTTVIHRADLQPLDNLELFGMAPLLTLDSYRAIGRNAAAHALGKRPSPVPTEIDNFARAKLIVQTTLLQALETGEVEPGAPATVIELRERGVVTEII